MNLDTVTEPFKNPIFNFCADSSEIHTLYEYFVLGAEDPSLGNLQGDFEQDNHSGIHHIYFGADSGVLKKASFQKTDQEYLPEARFASEGNFRFNQLANVYDVSLEMVGNNLFKVGQYVYFDTGPMGAGQSWERNEDGTVRSWANLMGLGGYHLVTEVANSISLSGYNTTVKARWQSSGIREDWDPGGSPSEPPVT